MMLDAAPNFWRFNSSPNCQSACLLACVPVFRSPPSTLCACLVLVYYSFLC